MGEELKEKLRIAESELPKDTQLEGLRPMTASDVPQVTDLLRSYFEKHCEVYHEMDEDDVAY